jgi:transcriptional regulator with XRE-family HTH domain
MAHVEKRRLAITLRNQGMSYNQIKRELKMSKSTLSVWLRDIPLSAERLRELQHSEARIEKYRATMQKKREDRISGYYKEEKAKWGLLSSRELFIAGLFLYWGEGNKANRSVVSINNTDPTLIRFALYWFLHSLEVPKNKVQVFLHLYDDMDIENELSFWSKELNISRKNFVKPYIKKSKRSSLDQKGFGHGTCGIRVFGTERKERLLTALQAISEEYLQT